MTERFKIGLDLITIEDTSKEYGALNQDEVVDELNRLNEENEQLKSLIKALKKSNTDYVNQIKKAYAEKLSFGELANNCGVDLE